MIPILYPEGTTEYLTNGIGRLTDAISCTCNQERNGIYELTMKYPVDGIHAKEITANRIIYAVPEFGKRPQPLIICDVDKSLSSYINVTARHRSYDLRYYACAEFGQTDEIAYELTPVLYDANKSVVGTLEATIRYDVVESTTTWTLTLLYPSNGAYSTSIVTGAYIYAQPYIGRDMRLFLISAVSTSGNVKTVTASCAIEDDPPHERNMMTVSQALGYVRQYTNSIQRCPFTFSAQPTTPRDEWSTQLLEFWNEKPTSTRELIMDSNGQIQSIFGGEWEFDDFNCILHESRGSDNGVQYRYGKNISDISERINIDSLYTHAFSFWKGTASSSTNTQQGEYYVKKGTLIRALDDQYTSMFPTMRVQVIDASSEFEQEPTSEELDAYTKKYIELNSVGVPTVTINVSIIDLSGSEDYADIVALETINLCDTVTVVFPDFGVNVKAKITAIEYDVLLDRNSKVTIGKTDVKLSDVIAQNKADIVRTKNDLQVWADHMAERATEATSGWYGGNIRKNYDANDHKQQSVYIMNTDNVDTASRAVKVDGNGVSVSLGGAKGAYKAVIDLSTGVIYFGDSYWNLVNDTVYIKMDTGRSEGEFYVNSTKAVGGTLADHEERIRSLEERL